MLRSVPALEAHSALPRCRERFEFGGWLWGPRVDLAVFGGSALFALAAVGLGHALGVAGTLPDWGFIAFVIGIDVAHVHATLFRTYFDREEVRARRLRYLGIPLAAYLGGCALYACGSLIFWRALAYLALVHFVRQEIGWLRLYRARGARCSRLDARLDECALYAVALYPVLLWHADLEGRHFSWFVAGDFVTLPASVLSLVPALRVGAGAVVGLFVARQLWIAIEHGALRAGVCLVIMKTAVIWYVGIVFLNSDFDFTVTNVVAHGAPYFVLLWAYARERKREAPRALGSRLASGGVLVFLGVLLVLAFAEEAAWDRFVWHDRAWLFGSGPELRTELLTFIVPLLAVPQLTHYLLDGLLWRRAESERLPAQRRALGLESAA
jgi:hypothetical protein